MIFINLNIIANYFIYSIQIRVPLAVVAYEPYMRPFLDSCAPGNIWKRIFDEIYEIYEIYL